MSERPTGGEFGCAVFAAVGFLLMFLALGATKGYQIGIESGIERMQREAIEHNAAHYDPQTGLWQWRETQ